MNTPNSFANASRIEDLERTCFVIMPFGKKKVGDGEVDFTQLYEELFEPAIAEAKTPEGAPLMPKRTDMEAFSGSINQDMYEYIMYSRLAIADITGFNPNVFYEIGARHATQEAGTVLLRQKGHAIPFDIATIKVFEYLQQPASEAVKSREFITHVLTESLARNRLDSPVRLALRAQWSGPIGPSVSPATTGIPPGSLESSAAAPLPRPVNASVDEVDWRKLEVDRFLRDAEEAVRMNDLEAARMYYWGALRFNPTNLIARMRLGLVLKQQGHIQRALEEFITVTKLVPNYAEAWKEKGVAEGLIARSIPPGKRPKWLADGSESLKRATLLNPSDFDAWASLGGVYSKVLGDLDLAQRAYERSVEVSDGHPYPLLNALKLQARRTQKLNVEGARAHLDKAASMRLAQADATPPADTPWCLFDLAEINLYKGEEQAFLHYLERGIRACTVDWQPQTLRDTLQSTLVASGISLSGLAAGIARLDEAIKAFQKA